MLYSLVSIPWTKHNVLHLKSNSKEIFTYTNLWENTAQDNESSTWTLFLLLAIETCGWGSVHKVPCTIYVTAMQTLCYPAISVINLVIS